jgi:hypothetical protein
VQNSIGTVEFILSVFLSKVPRRLDRRSRLGLTQAVVTTGCQELVQCDLGYYGLMTGGVINCKFQAARVNPVYDMLMI